MEQMPVHTFTSGNISSPASGSNTSFDFGFTGYSIGNVVWWDNNNNGTKDNGEIGIGGVNVVLLNSSGVQISSTTTSILGKYYFGGLNPGSYQIAVASALSSGNLNGATLPTTTTTADVDNNNNGSATDPLGTGHTSIFFSSISELITLGSKAEPTNESDEDPNTDQPDNQSNMTIDFGFVPPRTALGNLVYLDVNRDGDYDAHGVNPDTLLQNVKVYLYKDLNNDGQAETKIDSMLTTSRGLYKFIDLGAGVFKITIAPSNFVSGGRLYQASAYTNAYSGDTITDNNGEGTSSTNIWLRPNVQITTDIADDTLTGIQDNDANFTFDFGFNGGALPVKWLYFKASLVNNAEDALLNWATASEINNSHFEVQRSLDARNFETIATVQSKSKGGSSNSNLYYELTDKSVSHLNKDLIYYRVKQVDYDGMHEFTQIEALALNKVSGVRVYPSPITDVLTIVVNHPTTTDGINVVITDMSGKVVLEESFKAKVDQYFEKTMSTSHLASGYYTVTVTDGENLEVFKVKK